MYIIFKTNKIQKLCESFKEGCKVWDKKVAEKVILRLNQIVAAPNLKELKNIPQLHFHPLKGDRKDLYSITVIGRKRMTLKPHGIIEKDIKTGGLDLSKITNVIIMEVIDYHDGKKRNK